MNRADTVAAERKRVGHHAQSVLSYIESKLAWVGPFGCLQEGSVFRAEDATEEAILRRKAQPDEPGGVNDMYQNRHEMKIRSPSPQTKHGT